MESTESDSWISVFCSRFAKAGPRDSELVCAYAGRDNAIPRTAADAIVSNFFDGCIKYLINIVNIDALLCSDYNYITDLLKVKPI